MRVTTTEFADLQTEEERAGSVITIACGLEVNKAAKVAADETEFVITTGSEDRMGDDMVPEGGDLRAWRKNPVVLYGHDYHGLPVGKGRKIWIDDDGKTHAIVKWVPKEIYEFADTVKRMVKEGFLNAASIGFRALQYSRKEDSDGRWLGYTFEKWEMLEFSIVPVPANSEALVIARGLDFQVREPELKEWLAAAILEEPALAGEEEKALGAFTATLDQITDAVIMDLQSHPGPVKPHGTSHSSDPWDAGSNVKRLRSEETADYYREMFAWREQNEAEESSLLYKFPHHFVDEDGEIGAASLAACRSITALLRRSSNPGGISNLDKVGVFEHVAAHLRDAGEEVPEFKGVDMNAPAKETEGVDAKTLHLLMDAVRSAALEAVQAAISQEILPAIERALAGKVSEKICDEFDLLNPEDVKSLVRAAIRKQQDRERLAVLGRLPEEV